MPRNKSRAISITFAALSLLILLAHPNGNDGARILAYFPTPVKSHLIIHSAVANAMAEAGHNVTVIASLPNVNPNAKYEYRHFDLDGITMEDVITKDMINKPKPMYQNFFSMMSTMIQKGNESFSHTEMQQFLRDNGPGSFDLIILGYIMNDFLLGMGVHFNCPVVLSLMIQPIPSINNLIGNPNEEAYVPTLFDNNEQPLTFWPRVKNYLIVKLNEYVFGPWMDNKQNQLYRHHFASDRYPPFHELKKNISLVLTNHHFSQGPIRPNVPALIEMGGIQIKEKQNPLPEDVAEVLDNAKDGVIYFSLGTVVKGSILSEEKSKIMFNVLSKLPYKVLWKWTDAVQPGISANIVYKRWLPQDDVLAHPNIKLFITHGGQGSVVESQYHGVPMVGIPLFGDQPTNMFNVERNGFGLAVDYVTLTEETFGNAINEVLNNPKYSEAVKKFSTLYRDRPMTARQTVVYWIEYVLRHKGARHLQSPAVHLNSLQLMSLDVIAFLLAIVSSVILIFVKLGKLLCRQWRKRATPKSKVSKKKKSK